METHLLTTTLIAGVVRPKFALFGGDDDHTSRLPTAPRHHAGPATTAYVAQLGPKSPPYLGD